MFLTKEDFETGGLFKERDVFSADMFEDRNDRTLLLGYDINSNNTRHIYLMDCELCVIVYDSNNNIVSDDRGEFEELHSVLPSKRTYPESTDREFSEILAKHDVSPVFTTYNEKRAQQLAGKSFHGKTHKDDLKIPRAFVCPR